MRRVSWKQQTYTFPARCVTDVLIYFCPRGRAYQSVDSIYDVYTKLNATFEILCRKEDCSVGICNFLGCISFPGLRTITLIVQ